MLAVAAGRIAAAGPSSASRLHTLGVDLTGDDRTGWPAPGSFDVVYTSMVLHHVPDAQALLTTFHELMTPGALLLLADLEDSGGGRGGPGSPGERPAGADPRHTAEHGHDEPFPDHRGYRRGQIEDLVSAAGFTPTAFETVFVVRREVEGEQPIFLAASRRVP